MSERSGTIVPPDSSVIADYLSEKHGRGPSKRWERRVGEYHASETGKCPRKLLYKYLIGSPPTADSYVYFELGNELEDLYGRALASRYGEEYVLQDMNVVFRLSDDTRIVGEADWCVLNEPFRGDSLEYEIEQDGTRWEITDGSRTEIGSDDDTMVEHVVETKTTKSLDFKRGGPDPPHRRQVITYMRAADAPGSVAYMTRNELNELVHPISYSESEWIDVEYRLDNLHETLTEATESSGKSLQETEPSDCESLPPTDPYGDTECRFCDYSEVCRSHGGSVWEG